MPSLRSKLLNFILKQTVKKQLGRAAEISDVRERVESRAAKYSPPEIRDDRKGTRGTRTRRMGPAA